jgi:hypothetical protein
LAYSPLRHSVLRDLLASKTPPTPETAAEAHALEALEALAWLAQNAKSEAARVSAANAVLDRILGKPAAGLKAAAEVDDESGPLEVRWLDPS